MYSSCHFTVLDESNDIDSRARFITRVIIVASNYSASMQRARPSIDSAAIPLARRLVGLSRISRPVICVDKPWIAIRIGYHSVATYIKRTYYCDGDENVRRMIHDRLRTFTPAARYGSSGAPRCAKTDRLVSRTRITPCAVGAGF